MKALFNHHAFRDEVGLSGVNSINWARIVAQIVYYFVAGAALGAPHRARLLRGADRQFRRHPRRLYRQGAWACRSSGWSIATNENDILARCLDDRRLRDAAACGPTQSPSMDIQISSNFERLLFEAYGRDSAAVRGLMGGLAQSGRSRVAAGPLDRIRAEFDAGARRRGRDPGRDGARPTRETGHILDPHTAVGVGAARAALARDPATPMVALGTAHPAKFPDAVERATGRHPPLPGASGRPDGPPGADQPRCRTIARRSSASSATRGAPAAATRAR